MINICQPRLPMTFGMTAQIFTAAGMGRPNFKVRTNASKYINVLVEEKGQSKWKGVLAHGKKNLPTI